MSRANRIRHCLLFSFSPEVLEIENESHLHQGHLADSDGETHFYVRVVSSRFNTLGKVAQHRAIHQALKSEFEKGLHALRINSSGIQAL